MVQESVRFLSGVNGVGKLLFGVFEIDYDESHVSLEDIKRQMSIVGFPPEDEMRAELNSSSIQCQVCAGTVKDSLASIDGISSVNVDHKKKTIEIELDNSIISIDEIKSHLAELGFPADTN